MRLDSIDVGARIRSLRKRRKLSLNQLASMTGIAASNLSSIELNKTSPTLGTLARIADAFDVKISSLVDEIFYQKVFVCLPEKPDQDVSDSGNVTQRTFTRNLSMNSMDVTSVSIESESQMESHEGIERFIYCLEGHLQAQVEDVTYDIRKHTGLYLMPEVSATIKSMSKSGSVALIINQTNSK